MVIDTPKPVTNAVGMEKRTDGEATKAIMPMEKINNPIQAVLLRPKRWAKCGLARPATTEANPIEVPCSPAMVSEVP